MVNSASSVSGLAALDQLIESFINAKPAPQASAVPADTVTLSEAAAQAAPPKPAVKAG